MIVSAKITHRLFTESGMYVQLHIPMVTDEMFQISPEKDTCEVIFADDNSITAKQRKLIHATINDISEFTGEKFDRVKQLLKENFCIGNGLEDLSFKECSKEIASDFIDFLLEFCFLEDIPLNCSQGIERAYNITAYLSLCLKYRKCAICGKLADRHHVDAIGMGRDRRVVDDSKMLKMSLCRVHHTEAHTIGVEEFNKKYHVFGIVWNEKPDEKMDWYFATHGEGEDYLEAN